MSAGRTVNTQSQDWNTPPKYIELIHNFFDDYPELDPCSNQFSLVKAKTEFILPINGLEQDWNYKTIYINPPYGRNHDKTSIKDWIRKAYETNQKYNSEILMLIPVATNTSHWKNYIFGKATIAFLYDTRLKFYFNGEEMKKGAPMSCAMIYYGNQKEKFKQIFSTTSYIFIC